MIIKGMTLTENCIFIVSFKKKSTLESDGMSSVKMIYYYKSHWPLYFVADDNQNMKLLLLIVIVSRMFNDEQYIN